MSALVQLTETWRGVDQPCFIDPDTVTAILPLETPGTTLVEYGARRVVSVLGTPLEVHATLFGSPTEGGDK